MEKASRELRSTQRPSYAESANSNTPTPSPGGSSFENPSEPPETPVEFGEVYGRKKWQNTDSSDDEQEFDDVFQVAHESSPIRTQPGRSTKDRVSYTTTKKRKRRTAVTRRKQSKLRTDLAANLKEVPKPLVETQRNKIRLDIEKTTKARRNAFLLAHKDYFLPLLPKTNYIGKIERMLNLVEPATEPHITIESQPSGVVASMKPYQLEGLSFLVYMYRNGMSAILGDEMGLGKTLQTLSLFQYLKDNEPLQGENRPCLVVCPLSVLSSWMSEAKKWVPAMHTIQFHGPKAERQKLKADCLRYSKPIDIMVTTYDTFAAEQNWFHRAFVWRYCVLDEGHKIKNEETHISVSLQSLTAEFRLVLTGTPLQNNLKEMWALLHWLYPQVFTKDTAEHFKRAFDLTRGKVSTSFMDDSRRLLELIMLRRMKSSPNVNLGLPPKEEVLLFVPLTPMQRFWYTRFLTKVNDAVLEELFKGAKAKENESIQQEAREDDAWAESREIMEKAIQNEQIEQRGSEWRKLMNLVMQLRKVCSHPYIFKAAAPDPYYLGEHVKTASGKFIVLDKLVEELVVRKQKKIIIFAGFTSTLDLCEDLLMLKGANSTTDASFRYLRLDGGTPRARRNLGIRLFNHPKGDVKVMLISTRAGGLGINLASATDVVFMDEDWNPQITLQAEARAHRIGQTQKVTIYKLCTQGTVEEQMMGRIRKKLYLSAKITESMRNIHSTVEMDKKRKRGKSCDAFDEDAPQLDATSLKSLLRRGAQTLSRPEVDVKDMLNWDWETTLEKCKDKSIDNIEKDEYSAEAEQSWLNSMEKVECAIFEGKKHHKKIEKEAARTAGLSREERRFDKNTTVMIDGFAVSKESVNCADWEAVPTLAGKDPRLAEPKKEKRAAIKNQEFCQHCLDGGHVVCCSGCPRSYHVACLNKDFQGKAKSKMMFYCPQHECVDCKAKTADAGGLIFRCRWCEHAYCEDCLDWDTVDLVGEVLPEFEMLGYEERGNSWYIDCPSCVKHWATDSYDRKTNEVARKKIQSDYAAYLLNDGDSGMETPTLMNTTAPTPDTTSEAATPEVIDLTTTPPTKKVKRSRI